jgi:serine/threonine protein kinase
MPLNNLIGQKLYNGRYEVKSFIGSGGMSYVFEGFDCEIERKVAIKVLKPELSENSYWVRVFHEEAITATRCDHPHIVKIFDIKAEGNLHYIVMQLLPTGLKTLLKKEGTLTPLRAVTILRDIAEALSYVHKKNIIHKDIKTGNIMFDEHNYPILTDFGIAMSDDSTRMAGPTGAGTPGYMAPEQFKGETVDSRADIYSLGIVLYELTTGRRPFEAEDDYAVLYKQLHEPLPGQPLVDYQIPERIIKILFKCLALSPTDRYQSTDELIAAFDDIIKNPPTPKPIRIKRRLNPAILIPIAIVVVAIVYFLIKSISIIGNGNDDGRIVRPPDVPVNHSSPIAKISFNLLDADEKKTIPYPGATGKIRFKSPNMDTTFTIFRSNIIVEFDTSTDHQYSNTDTSNINLIHKIFLPKQDINAPITVSDKVDYYEPVSIKIGLNPDYKTNYTLSSSSIAKWCTQCGTQFKYGDTICQYPNCPKPELRKK